MYSYTKKLLPKSSIELIVDIKKEFIKKEYEKGFNKLLAELEIEGFRKGKVPANRAIKEGKTPMATAICQPNSKALINKTAFTIVPVMS